MEEIKRDHGPQPLDRLMESWQLTNHELVSASDEQLNHKQVQKARKGRQLTLHLMQKITRAFNASVGAKLSKEHQQSFSPYLHRSLFNYAKNYDPTESDPNETMKPQ